MIKVAVKDCIFGLNLLRNIIGFEFERCGHRSHENETKLLLRE
jgi:hypothetical protein